MILWTVQSPEFAERLRKRGRVYGDWRRVTRDWIRAYRWMAEQMVIRGVADKPSAPIWAWRSYEGKGRRPDMRTLWSYEPQVRITLSVPDELALLSDFDAWHAVLNDCYLSVTETEDEESERLAAAGCLTRALIEESWSRVFHLNLDGNWIGSPDTIQACLPYLDLSWVRRVEHFRGRPRRRGAQ